MAARNAVTLRGEVAAPVEVRSLPSGTALATVVVRVPDEGRRTSIPVTVWDPPAELSAVVEGAPVEVKGRLRRRFWSGADGRRQSRVEVVADTVRDLTR